MKPPNYDPARGSIKRQNWGHFKLTPERYVLDD